jgi:hypothetical protein
VLPVIRKRPPETFDVGAAYREWEEAGKPLRPEAEARRLTRSEDALTERIWITGDEANRPPAKALTIPDRNLPYSQENSGSYRLALPPLVVEVTASRTA